MKKGKSAHFRHRKKRQKKFPLRKGYVASMLLVFTILVFSVFLGMSRGSLSTYRIVDYAYFSGNPALAASDPNSNLQMQTFSAVTPTPLLIARQNDIRRSQLKSLNLMRTQGALRGTTTDPFTNSCADKVDVIIALDTTIMTDTETTEYVKAGAYDLVQAVSAMQNSRVGLITYDTTARLDIGLTSDLPTVDSLINRATRPNVAVSGSCISCAAQVANKEYKTQGRSTTANIVFLFTNGRATHIDGFAAQPPQALQAATSEIARGHSELKTVYNTVSYSDIVNPGFISNIGPSTGGSHYVQPDRTQFANALNLSLQNFCQ